MQQNHVGKLRIYVQTHVGELRIYAQRAMQGTAENNLLLMNTRFNIREVREFTAAPAADSLHILDCTFYRPGNFRSALPRATGPKVIMMQGGAGWPLRRRGREGVVVSANCRSAQMYYYETIQ